MTDISSVSTGKITAQPVDQRLKEAAQAFEAILLRDMIKSMRNAELDEDLLGSNAGNQFRDMMDSQFAGNMAATDGGLGVAKMLAAEWSKQN